MTRDLTPRFLLAIPLLLVPATAHAQWLDLPGTQPHALDTATPLAPAVDCITCHGRGDSDPASAYMPADTWLGSMMGNAVRDPLYQAALTVAEQDHAGIGDFCLRCHTPNAFIAGRTRADATAGFGRTPPLLDSDGDGVTCDGCHRMTDHAADGNAQYIYSTDDTRFGPYDDSVSMRHASAQSTYTAESRLCGTCHALTNPLVMRVIDGTPTTSPMPLDTTYDEWAASAFARAGSADARTCQDCHMPHNADDGFVTTTGGTLRTMPRRHDFVGANVWGIHLVRDTRNDPAVTPFYDLAAARAQTMLESAARLTIMQAPMTARAGETVQVVARLENLSGHKLPTGYADGRRVWLEVALVDAAGTEQVISGRYDATTAVLDETDTQLRVYEAVHGRAGVAEEHLALHDTVVRDTRIPPREMMSSEPIAPVGRDYSGGANGTQRNDDVATYSIAIPAAASGTVTLRVRAMYQSTTRAYIEFLEHENHTDDRGTRLRAAWEASGRAAPLAMATATSSITIDNSIADAGTDAAADVTDAANDGIGGDVASDSTGANEMTARPAGCGCRTESTESHRGSRSTALLLVLLGFATRRVRRRNREHPLA